MYVYPPLSCFTFSQVHELARIFNHCHMHELVKISCIMVIQVGKGRYVNACDEGLKVDA